jgi:uncharacterized BrkB/YihY/UPF0761 family membrane protein
MRFALAIAVCFSVFSTSSWAQTELDRFRKQFYSSVEISTFGTEESQFASLSRDSRTDLIAARSALVSFFSAIENIKADPRTYLEKSFASKFKERGEIGRKLFGQETTLLTVGFTGFSIQQSTIELHFYVVTFGEGNIVSDKASARLQKTTGVWKIIEVGGLK